MGCIEMVAFARRSLLFAVLLIATTASAYSQQKAKPSAPPPSQPAQQKPETAAPPMPDQLKANLLIRTSIIALNQANLTGNYTVLLDLGAPVFRASNDSTRLAQIFVNLRQRKVDLSPILFFSPTLLAPPQAGPNSTLRLVGFFPTTPERVNFELIFQFVDGQWKIFGIGVALSPAQVANAPEPQGQGKLAPKSADAKPAAKAAAGKSKDTGQTASTGNKAATTSNWDTTATSSITPTDKGAVQLNLAPQ
jgi:hypothetical protein